MYKLLIFLTVGLLSVSCASDPRKNFKFEMDYNIGSVFSAGMVSFSENKLIKNAEGYVVDYDNGCKVQIVVGETSGVIESWRYLSNPDLCVIRTKRFSAW